MNPAYLAEAIARDATFFTITDEEVLRAGPCGITLTTHRLRHEAQRFGSYAITSIMLEQVTSCCLTHRSKPGWLVLAAFSVLNGFLLSAYGVEALSQAWIVGIVVALVALLIYSFSHAHELAFTAANSVIRVSGAGIARDTLLDLIEATEAAKNARVTSLATNSTINPNL